MKKINKILSMLFISLMIFSIPMEAFAKNSPAVPTASMTTSSQSATLKWNKISNASGYVVSFSSNSSFKNAKTYTVSSSKTSYTVKGLKNGSAYYGRVKSYKVVNKKKYYSKYSEIKRVTVGVKDTYIKKITPAQAVLSIYCNEVSGVSGYQYQYSKTSDFKNSKSIISKNPSVTIKKLGNANGGSQKYFVRVRTYKVINNKKYYSNWSKYKSATTKKVTLPKEPYVTSISSSINNGVVTATINFLKYDSNTTGYQIKAYTNNLYTKMVYSSKTINSSTIKITTLKSDSVYYIKIRSVRNLNGVEYYGDWITPSTNIIVTPTTTVSKPKITSLNPIDDNTKVKLIWTKSSESNASYVVQVSKSSSFNNNDMVTQVYHTSDNYITVSTDYDFKYYFRVKTVAIRNDKTYYSDWSEVVSLEITNPLIPTTPEIVSTTTTINSVKLTWSECKKTEYYTVQYGQKSNFSDAITQKVETTSFTAKDLFDGETYYFRVRANNSDYSSKYVSTNVQTKARVINQGVVATKATANSPTTTKYGQSGWTFNKPCLYSQYAFKLWKGDNAESEKKFDEYYHILKRVYKETGCNDSMDDVTKFIRITEWIYCNVDYADEDRVNIDITAYEAVSKGKTTCMGYAALFVDLCYLANIPAYYVGSDRDTTFNHAYAVVKLNGYWYIVDPQAASGFGKCLNYGDPYNNLFKENLDINNGVGGLYYLGGISKYWNRMAVDYKNVISKQCIPFGTSETNKKLDNYFLYAFQQSSVLPLNARNKENYEWAKENNYNVTYKSSYTY